MSGVVDELDKAVTLEELRRARDPELEAVSTDVDTELVSPMGDTPDPEPVCTKVHTPEPVVTAGSESPTDVGPRTRTDHRDRP